MKPTLVDITKLINAYGVDIAVTAAHEGQSVVQAVDAAFEPFRTLIPEAMIEARHAGYPIEIANYENSKRPLAERVPEARQGLSDTIQNFAESITTVSPVFGALVATADQQERLSLQRQHEQSPLFDLVKNLKSPTPLDQSENRSNNQDNSMTR